MPGTDLVAWARVPSSPELHFWEPLGNDTLARLERGVHDRPALRRVQRLFRLKISINLQGRDQPKRHQAVLHVSFDGLRRIQHTGKCQIHV